MTFPTLKLLLASIGQRSSREFGRHGEEGEDGSFDN